MLHFDTQVTSDTPAQYTLRPGEWVYDPTQTIETCLETYWLVLEVLWQTYHARVALATLRHRREGEAQ